MFRRVLALAVVIAACQDDRPPRSLTTAELRRRLARFKGMADGATERAEIDAFFGEERLDDRTEADRR